MMKNKITSFFTSPIVYVLLIGFLLRLIFSLFGTLNLDQGTFIAWSNTLSANGFKNFYNGWSDYFPGYLYILWVLGKINSLGIVSSTIFYKLPAIVSDLLTGLLIYKILQTTKGKKWGLIGCAIYIFNPAILSNSTLWGQVDSLTSLFSLLSVYLLQKSFLAKGRLSSAFYFSAVSLAFGTLVKPQTAFIFPAILFLLVKNGSKIAGFVKYCFTGLFVFVAGFIPFWNHGNLLSFISERTAISLNQYPYTSVNAFNFWGLNGMWKPDNIYFQAGGYLLFVVALIFIMFKLRKHKNPGYYLLTFIFAASFVFFTRMHERHMLPLFAPLAVIAIENPIFLIPYLGFSLTYVANLYFSYIWITSNFKEVFSDFVIKFMELLNISFIVFIFYSLARGLKLEWKRLSLLIHRSIGNKKVEVYGLPKIVLSPKKAKYILLAILVFAFVSRTFNLGSPPNEYFDEVYHAFTAKVMTHEDANKAWEWWNTPPEGFAYEWTHPPLAKLGMVVGMKIFGENSFGYRIPGAILGTGSVFLIYLLAKFLFKDEATGLLSSAVFSLDGLPLVMSRIGMNDSYLLFFVLLSIYLFLLKKDFWSAVSFGLAISSKWSAIWAVPILGIIWVWRAFKGRTFKASTGLLLKPVLLFMVLTPVIYLLTYLPMFLTGHDLSVWWGMQEQMWWYHTGLKATHAYSSFWWSWPFLIRPIYLYTSDELGGTVARIYAMGNPLVFWFGLASVALSLVYAYLEKNKHLAFVVFSYLIFFVPWALSPRIMFFYHYLPSIPFLAIATGYVLRRNFKLIAYFLVPSALLFIYFYPHWTGLTVPLWLDTSYYWISSWR